MAGRRSRTGSGGELPDLAETKGQEAAKRALEVAAAGGHSILLVGPAGSGKTLLAQCLPGLLPAPGDAEASAIADSYRRAGLDPPEGTPFRAPDFNTRPTALVGRGRNPGEVDLALGGVLFLDDLPAFGRRSLRALRPLLEAPNVLAARPGTDNTAASHRPFLLVAAMRSCPCGRSEALHGPFSCARWEVARYWSAVEELVLDLVHLHVEVPAIGLSELKSRSGETSRRVAERVLYARTRQLKRSPGLLNALLPAPNLPASCEPDRSGQKLLDTAFDRLGLSVRSVGIILRIARTIADLAGSEVVRAPHVAEAIQYRSLSRCPGRARDDEEQS